MEGTKITINGEPFVCSSMEVTPTQDIEFHPKKFEWGVLPDGYGGIPIPIPVNPHDRKPVVVGQEISGEVTLPAKAIRHLWSLVNGDDVLLVDIGVPELDILLENVWFEGSLPCDPCGFTKAEFVASDISTLE